MWSGKLACICRRNWKKGNIVKNKCCAKFSTSTMVGKGNNIYKVAYEPEELLELFFEIGELKDRFCPSSVIYLTLFSRPYLILLIRNLFGSGKRLFAGESVLFIRTSPSEFVMPLAKDYKAVCSNQISLDMRFRMMFEIEESGTRRWAGMNQLLVTGVLVSRFGRLNL